MYKPWKINNDYKIPEKPASRDEQISMIWDMVFNHLPSRLHEQDKKIIWQDRKLNFVLIFLAILMAWATKMAFS